ncbi:MAG: Na+/H+ antiporter [Pseudomonadota bacterium]
METISIVLVMLIAVVASGYLARLSPLPLPAPLVQIATGALIAYATHFRVALDPEIFFLLFLPPLLFLDGWRIPKHGLFRDGWTILELALGLVVFTVVGVGFFIHWLIPAMPLAVAFALAAVLSPTDPIAVSGIAARTPIPKRVMRILEGESLLNDASGLVCLRFAVAAALTGGFSLADASLTFLRLALGGVAIGISVTWSVAWAKDRLGKSLGEESGSQILISLLIPFAAYLLAERLHCSGILAAVAAGITMSYVEITGRVQAVTRVRRNVVWDTIHFSLNGIIFILLGEQLPGIVASAAATLRASGNEEVWRLALYVGSIALALALLRLVWVWTSVRFTLFRRGLRRGQGAATGPSWRLIAAMSLAGVRGAITLAGVLTLPLALNDGTPFPARDLAILLAASVIVVSMLLAAIFLPLLLKSVDLPAEPSQQAAEEGVRVAAAEAAIRAIEDTQHAMAAGQADADLYADAAARLMDLYRQRIEGRSLVGEGAAQVRKIDDIERRLRLAGLKAEREAVFRAARGGDIEDDLARRLVREIDLIETRYSA